MDFKTYIISKTNLQAIKAWIWIKLDNAKKRNAKSELVEDMEELVKMIEATIEGFEHLERTFSLVNFKNSELGKELETLKRTSNEEIRRLTVQNENLKQGL